jgi:hypothetical protein
MYYSSKPKARPRIGRALATLAAALLCTVVLGQPNPAQAARGGGFGGGGFHGDGFHGGGFHGGGFGGVRGDGFHGERFDGDRFRGFTGFGFYPYYGYYDYGDYGNYGQPYSQIWYYCADPAGYYPYVTQCNIGWQAVPAS